ncbi:MAG TPA: hypothetical protein VM096_01045 [Vicinamibacterales bacterium]|nr:hypothetical protein [Vicinamibacterales bacterium]
MRLLLTVVVLTGALTSSATLAAERVGGRRIRPQDPRLNLVLQEGTSRSETFRALVNRIEASNVIVYVAGNPLMRSSLSGALTWMTGAGNYRYVRASISIEQPFDQMIASVAHELQHVVEVIEDESVTDEKSLTALYKRIGQPSRAAGPLGWETIAAQRTGTQVRRELIAMPAMTMARASDNRQS